ncbi:DMT family transporter [Streptomyces smyrnaeus]|uniref:DMT family transporter n=1 Tax=Streptomyces smyrnaeus TaxID=1387713 RepID=UPI0033C52DC5
MRACSRGLVIGVGLIALVAAAGPAEANDRTLAAGDSSGGGLLGPWNVKSSEGVRLEKYELFGGGDTDFTDAAMRFMTEGLFALARTVVGACCWLVDWAYRFPIVDNLTSPAQHVSDAYRDRIVEPLGLVPLFLAWAFVFGLVLIMRGKVGRGAGEILLTLLICALSASTLVRPDYLLGYEGPVQQVQRAALEGAVITAKADREAKPDPNDPCEAALGPARQACQDSPEAKKAKKRAERAAAKKRAKKCEAVVGPSRETCISEERAPAAEDVSKPITKTLTDVLVVQPYQLLQWGRTFDKEDPAYDAYKKTIGYQPKDRDCDSVPKPFREYCNSGGGSPESGEPQRKLMDKEGEEGKAASAYNKELTWSRLLGALCVLIAVLIFALIILAMVIALVCAQFTAVCAAAVGLIALAWAVLPGPNRGAAWKWLGVFAAVSVAMFGIALFIPFLGIACKAVLTNNDSTVVVERLILLDGLALAGLVGHRWMLRQASGMGQRFAMRLRYAKVGGSHTLGEQAAATSMALASLGVGSAAGTGTGGGLGLGRGYEGPWGSFQQRRAKLAAGMAALADGAGTPGHPGPLLGQARAEARRALAPLSVPLRAAKNAWVGKPPDSGPGGPAGPGAPGGPATGGGGPLRPGGGRPGPHDGAAAGGVRTVIDGRTGEILSQGGEPEDVEGQAPQEMWRPVGERLRERVARTRGGRVMLGAGRVAWHSTVGLPAAVERSRGKSSEYAQRVQRHVDHYQQQATQWWGDTRAGSQRIADGARRVAAPVNEADRWLASPAPRTPPQRPNVYTYRDGQFGYQAPGSRRRREEDGGGEGS